MQRICFSHTRSLLLLRNEGCLYAVLYTGLAGIFRKDIESSRIWGRAVCDAVKAAMGHEGFFSSDELPRYGISRAEKRYLFEVCKATPQDLIVCYAYPYETACATDACVRQHLSGHLSINPF